MIWYMIWYDMIWYMIWYDTIYDIYLTTIWLPPIGSSTVHIYTQTIHRTTQFTKWEKCWPCPVFARYTLAFALQLRKKHGKTSVRVQQERNLSAINKQVNEKCNYTEKKRKFGNRIVWKKIHQHFTEKLILVGVKNH
jgi:hypothetical protein